MCGCEHLINELSTLFSNYGSLYEPLSDQQSLLEARFPYEQKTERFGSLTVVKNLTDG